MARHKTLEERLMGAAVLKVSFALQGTLDSPVFQSVYPGVLEDLHVDSAQVDTFIQENRAAVEEKARKAARIHQ